MKKSGFTLVELIMVVAIIALIAGMAIPKLAGLRGDTEKKLSLGNQARIEAAVETFLAGGGKLNRLDALVEQRTAAGSPGAVKTDGAGIFADGTGVEGENTGLDEGLLGQLSVYWLTEEDAAALEQMGLKTVMREMDGTQEYGEDGSLCQGATNVAWASSAYAKGVEAGMACAAIDPHKGGRTGGYVVYQGCGEEVEYVGESAGVNAVRLKGDTNLTYSAFSASVDALKAGEGLLVAFGLGDRASIVGNSEGGLDSAPLCPLVDKGVYPRYVLLFRLRERGVSGATRTEAEFAGVLDAKGQGHVIAKWGME